MSDEKKERPILFSGALVRAILSGAKTQTRRLVKPQPAPNSPYDGGTSWVFRPKEGLHIPVGTVGHLTVAQKMGLRCPFGAPGDRLWVRETWRPRVAHSHGMDACDCGDVTVEYRADGVERFVRDGDMPDEWTLPRAAKTGDVPSIHMPRWASRISLEVMEVRVARLQAITEEDARAEGVDTLHVQTGPGTLAGRPWATEFGLLWDRVYGIGSWDANPWVWCVSFRRLP